MPDAPRVDLLDPGDVARLGGLEIGAQGVVEGFLTGLHRSPFRGFSVEFTEHRAYQPGDELRYLDWKILARADRLFVKQFEEETNLRAMILVDVSRSMAWRGAPERLTKRAYADRLAAALALLLLRPRDATGLITFHAARRSGAGRATARAPRAATPRVPPAPLRAGPVRLWVCGPSAPCRRGASPRGHSPRCRPSPRGGCRRSRFPRRSAT